MTAQHDAPEDIEICCLCNLCKFGRMLKGIKEPTAEESAAAASRLETDKLQQAARQVAQDQDRLRELQERVKAMSQPQGVSAERMRQFEELLVFGEVRTPTPKEDKIAKAFNQLYDLLEASDDFSAESVKKLALMRVTEARVLWENK